ncbi:MAG: carbon storage regulator [Planctomycetes bacterium]|nr:carbon storage regulator [Planctomycetota bacterium]
MLVLSRRVGEEIVIDGCIRITITAVKADRVRVGVSAPPSIAVDRKEVHDRRAAFTSTELTDCEVLPCCAR